MAVKVAPGSSLLEDRFEERFGAGQARFEQRRRVEVVGGELHGRVDQEAAAAAGIGNRGFEVKAEEALEALPDAPRPAQQRAELLLAGFAVAFKGVDEEGVLIAVGVVETLPVDAGARDQILDRGRGVAPLPEQLHGLIQNLFLIELFFAGHLPLS